MIDNVDDFETEIDFMILYSSNSFNHIAYPKSSKSRSYLYTQIKVNFIIYHDDENRSIYMNYPLIPRQILIDALNKLNIDRLTIIKSIIDVCNDSDLIFHRCSFVT